MIFTASDVGSVAHELWWWEHAEYVFAALVAIACFGEYIADFNKRNWIVAHKDDIAKRSTLLLIAALALELVCLVQTNSLSGQLIGSLDEKAVHADSLAQSAITKSETALSKSSVAEGKADTADSKSDIAQGKADTAIGTASRAIALSATAREAASDALSRVARVDRYADLIAFKVSWRIVDGKVFHKFIDGKPTGTAEIWFEPDDEAFNFAGEIAKVLKDAGWTVSGPEPMSTVRKWTPEPPMSVLDDLRLSATMNGLAIGSKHLPDVEGRTPAGAFVEALLPSISRLGAGYIGGEYPSLPENHVVIVVGRHVPMIPPQNPYTPKSIASPSPSKKNGRR
jgi:hypothetical protein